MPQIRLRSSAAAEAAEDASTQSSRPVHGQGSLGFFSVAFVSQQVQVLSQFSFGFQMLQSDLQMRHFSDSSFPVCLSVSAPRWLVSLILGRQNESSFA